MFKTIATLLLSLLALAPVLVGQLGTEELATTATVRVAPLESVSDEEPEVCPDRTWHLTRRVQQELRADKSPGFQDTQTDCALPLPELPLPVCELCFPGSAEEDTVWDLISGSGPVGIWDVERFAPWRPGNGASADDEPELVVPGALRISMERGVNEAVFEQVYLVQKEALLVNHAGRWVAIVRGNLLPQNAKGQTVPSATLEELLVAIQDESEGASHRFVFRIGEEGEVRYRPTVNDNPEWIGSLLIGQIRGNLWIAPNGVFVDPGAKPGEAPEGPEQRATGPGPSGPNNSDPENVAVTPKGAPFVGGTQIGPGINDGAGPKARLFLHSPDGSLKTAVDATVSTGFQGYAVCGNEAAAAIGLAMWEIPGSLDMQFPHELRRARMRVTTRDGDFLDALIPVGIWADR